MTAAHPNGAAQDSLYLQIAVHAFGIALAVCDRFCPFQRLELAERISRAYALGFVGGPGQRICLLSQQLSTSC